MIENNLINKIEYFAQRHLKEMQSISDFLFKNPELGGEEFIACKFLEKVAADMGFKTVEGYCGLETAFLAELDNGKGPVLAIIVEYDALPGFGPAGGAAHACGHNWIAAVGMGTAMVIAELKEEFSGRLKIIGTPAMENLGCKAEMIKAHAFDDVDVVIQAHLEHITNIDCKFLALDAIEFTFKGRASHAASSPEEGISALDAAQFTFMGINALRQYLRTDVKMHGVITNGGEAPSVIPDIATCKYYIRADDRKYLEYIKPKIIRCAEGAALMAGAEMSVSYFENSLDNFMSVPTLRQMAAKYMGEEGIFEPEDKNDAGLSSSDIGNVSHICPTLYMEFDMEADGDFRVHDEIALQYVNSKFSYKKLKQVSKIMAEILMELFQNEELVKTIKREHSKLVRKNIVE